MLRSSLGLSRTFFFISNWCSGAWSTSLNLSARLSTAPLLKSLLSIPPVSSFMFPKIIRKLLIPSSAASRLTIKISSMSTLTGWLMDLCLHRPLPVPMPNSSTSTGISVMPTSLPFAPTVLALSDKLPFSMMTLKMHTWKCLWKRNLIPRMRINPSVILFS